ncbi:MAG: hypothetical protein BWX54_01661 [Verrucomicrobia bacterium ADurb.Bin018]|jgi:hypothetical protein|nr:MAG: hypothetical protein BWX54_01661 [Verrucomicrobia bacterium ADurb.Bin018]
MKLNPTLSMAMIIAFIATVLIVACFAHYTAGFGLPIPWWDEGQFLWPAQSIALNNTLLTEHLNPDRPIFLMLMGYSIVMGIIFKILPFSLEVGRGLSLVWIILSALLLGFIARKWSIRWLIWILISLFTISRPFVVASNIVRPEAFCWLMVVIAMAVANVRPWLSLSVLFLMPLVHPNGVLFAAAGSVAAGLTWPHMKRLFHRSDCIWFFVVCVAWSIMALHAFFHLNFFITDISFSLFAYPEPIFNKIQRILLNPEQSPYFIVAVGLAWFWKTRSPNRCWMAVLSATLLAVPAIRIQMWYTVFSAAGSLVSLALLLLWVSEQTTISTKIRGMTIAFLFLLAGWHLHRAGIMEGPRGYPHDMTWGWGMVTEKQDVPYITDQDRLAVAEKLLPLMSSNTPKRVKFSPEGDAFFFIEYAQNGLVGYQPVGGAPPADIVVFHDTRYIPNWAKNSTSNLFGGSFTSQQIHSRDTTETWTLIRPISTNEH